MIIRKQDQMFHCIRQHDHAYISGEIAKHWIEPVSESVLTGVYEHDRAWIPLDEKVRVATNQQMPYDFISFPLEWKLAAYTKGVDEVEVHSPYSAFLCSKHYCSFFSGSITSEPGVSEFLTHEENRQQSILNTLEVSPSASERSQDFTLLQFCDDLSLYICMNPPGIRKSDEVSWFKNGFAQLFPFAPKGIQAEWKTESEIMLEPFPFKESLTLTFSVYELPSDTWKQADQDIPLDTLTHYTQTVTLVPVTV
ncbi:DUF3891 family protein [Alkalicoccobacillus gibsonii]|uniref:DUF3891 family protein n=1 Tax=Alkalicoccobacillus gibsonii TaxID=79881 RepID=UPI003F7CACA1